MPTANFTGPGRDCDLCPRLVAFRHRYRESDPDWYNAPVPGFGSLDASLLIVGLAPGLKGANRTGRPFTGDFAGDLLYETLLHFGLANGRYEKHANDGLVLSGVRITNAVRCVPPQNKPVGAEEAACRPFLIDEIAAMKNLRCIIALGGLAHKAVITTFGERQAAWKFTHGAQHHLPNAPILADSYHCSRYNTNTGRLTTEMFRDVFTAVMPLLK